MSNHVKPIKMCGMCRSFTYDIREVLAFGYKKTKKIDSYCTFWLQQNRQGNKNALYNVSWKDIACTQFLSEKPILDELPELSGMNVYELIEGEDALPLADLLWDGYIIDKGTVIRDPDFVPGLLRSYLRDEEDENE